MKIINQNNILEVIGRLNGRANAYENSAQSTKNQGKSEALLKVVDDLRYFANTLAESFDQPEKAILHETYLEAVK